MTDRNDEHQAPSPPFRVGDWLVEPAQDTMRCGERVRHLEPKVMEALVALARRAGEVLSKAELTDAVWRVPFISENRLVGVIAQLRRAFDDDVHTPRYVETVPTRGYRLAPPVEWLGGEPSPEPGRESHFLLETADHTYRLREGANIIGREAEVDVCIASEWVSRRHARLQVDGDHALLEDLGSKNGTCVNGEVLTGPVQLHDGDEVRLGRGVVVLRFSSALVATRTESGGASKAP